MRYGLLLILILISSRITAQVHFESKIENFKVEIPTEPTENMDTIITDYGLLPRYLMISQEVYRGGRNIFFSIEILNTEEVGSNLKFKDFKESYISGKQSRSGKISWELVRESTEDLPVPYDVELVFLDRSGFLLFSRIFYINSKYYTLETVRIKSALKIGNNLNRATQDFFDSFKLIN